MTHRSSVFGGRPTDDLRFITGLKNALVFAVIFWAIFGAILVWCW